jgi:release factor glutamine methyltransferase
MSQTVWTIRDILQWAVRFFQEKDIDSPRLTIEMLLCHVLQCTRISLYMQFDKPLSVEELQNIRAVVKRRVAHEPTQYIIGQTQFFDMMLDVNPAVLIPRPETEELVVLCLDMIQRQYGADAALTILDIGTGSGCIALALARKYPSAQVFGIDISVQALHTARANAERYRIANVHFGQKDVLTEAFKRRYDVVISNPPYLPQQEMALVQPELLCEPHEALTDAHDGLQFYRRFAEILPILLQSTEKGFGVFEIGHNQAQSIRDVFHGYGYMALHKDFQGIERFAEVRIKM